MYAHIDVNANQEFTFTGKRASKAMMVTFISQCEKKALVKSRRVPDAFANRIGDNTWQTVFTEDGRVSLKKPCMQKVPMSACLRIALMVEGPRGAIPSNQGAMVHKV